MRESLGDERVDLGEDALLGLPVRTAGVHAHAEGLGLELRTLVPLDDRLRRSPELFPSPFFRLLAWCVHVALAGEPVLGAV